MIWVADRGFASQTNRSYLTRGGGHYIHAEKLRHTNTEAAAALARPGQAPAAASTGDGPAPPAPCVPVYPRDLQKILEEVPSELQEQPVR